MSIKFTMVMDEDTAKRMDYIASYYGRFRIKEIMWACKQYIKTSEENVDKIEIGDT